jgi:hypothetical protein
MWNVSWRNRYIMGNGREFNMDIILKKLTDGFENNCYLFFESGQIEQPILCLAEYQLKNLLRKYRKELLENE